jgi:hypothetical protein
MTTSPNLHLVTEAPQPPANDDPSKLDFAQAHFTVTAHAVINDYMDTRVRGYLKEHPDLIAYRLSELQHVLDTVRQMVDQERAAGKWGDAISVLDAAGELRDETEWFLGHRCDCDHCVRGVPTEPAPAAPDVRVFHDADGWTLPSSESPEPCHKTWNGERRDTSLCSGTAVWKVVERHPMHLTLSFWCADDLPAEHRHLAQRTEA